MGTAWFCLVAAMLTTYVVLDGFDLGAGIVHLLTAKTEEAVMSPSDAAISLDLKEQTALLLKTLTPREEMVIKMRFGMTDGSEHTLEEVGHSFAVTRERIRQIEAKALRKLRHPSRSRNFRIFSKRSKQF